MTQAAAQKALDLDDQLAEPQAVLAVVKYNYDWDWATAEKMFQRAITLNPNYATARQWYGECLLYQGRIDEGTAEIEHAYELDPASLIINTQGASHICGGGNWKGQWASTERHSNSNRITPRHFVA